MFRRYNIAGIIFAIAFISNVTRARAYTSDSPDIAGGRIVGGVDVDISELPFIVQLKTISDQFLCGGVILSSDYVLTAAHCLKGVVASNLKVVAGENEINRNITATSKNYKSILVEMAHKHDHYNSTNFSMDVALLKLKGPLSMGLRTGPISICDYKVGEEEVLEIAGWGHTQQNGSSHSNTLKKTQVSAVSSEICKKRYLRSGKNITDEMFCAGALGKDACQGDSGGPIIRTTDKKAVCGIVSWGIGCGLSRRAGVYADLASPKIREFIQKYVPLGPLKTNRR